MMLQAIEEDMSKLADSSGIGPDRSEHEITYGRFAVTVFCGEDVLRVWDDHCTKYTTRGSK